MATLLDRQLELGGLVLGPRTPYVVSTFDFGPTEIRNNDTDIPRGDGIRFGRDFRSGRLLTFDIVVDKRNGFDALASWSVLEKVWLGDNTRAVPADVSQLRFNYAGRPRCVFGRGRRFAVDKKLYNLGRVDITADFQCADHRVYSDDEFTHTIGIVPATSGGISAPVSAPVHTTLEGSAVDNIVVGGDDATWLVMTINGPIVNPVVDVLNFWQAKLNLTLAQDQSITIDPRPWARTVRRNDGASFAGAFTSSAPALSQMAVTPGTHEVVLRGTSVTGTASLLVQWRNAYLSP